MYVVHTLGNRRVDKYSLPLRCALKRQLMTTMTTESINRKNSGGRLEGRPMLRALPMLVSPRRKAGTETAAVCDACSNACMQFGTRTVGV